MTQTIMQNIEIHVRNNAGFQLDAVYDANQQLQPARKYQFIGQLTIRNICKRDDDSNEDIITSDFRAFIARKLSMLGKDFHLTLMKGGTRSKIGFLTYRNNFHHMAALSLDRCYYRGISLKVQPNGFTDDETNDLAMIHAYKDQREQVKLLILELYKF